VRIHFDWREPPTWLLGLLLALFTWHLQLSPPAAGLDGSWVAGLSMATHAGLHYGTEIVFTFGPLGFVVMPFVFYPTFGLLSLLYLSLVYVAFCLLLVWALRRKLPGWVAVLVGFLLLGLLPLVEQPLVLAALAALAVSAEQRQPWALNAYVLLTPTLAAVATLGKLSIGPVIVVVLVLGLIGARPNGRQVGAFVLLLVGQVAIFWFATGQTVGNVAPFIENTLQISSGYSSAMMRSVDVAAWKVTLATVTAILLSLGIVVLAARLPNGNRRARWCGVLLVAATTLTIYKEGVVRPDASHLSIFFSSACIVWIGLPWARARWLLVGVAAIAVIGIPMRAEGTPTYFNPVSNVKKAAEAVHTLASPGRREALVAGGRASGQALYLLEPGALAALEGHTMAVEPWEAMVPYVYGLDWRPQPIFQNYSAYTSHLDRLNSRALESPQGPERILRENPPLVYDEFPTPDIDGRLFGWDPPEQARAVLCNFRPLTISPRWEVLGRTADRCGAPRLVETVSSSYGKTVDVPAPGKGEVVFARIRGAGVGGLEKLTTALLHAASRHIIVNGSARYRLIPETATDGLLMAGDPTLVEPEGAFSPIPQARTIEVEGPGGELEFEFFTTKVAPVPAPKSEPVP
jgi:hypothetical protein